jgi:hypothetical protein
MGVGRDVEDSGGYVDWSIAERAHYRYIANNQQRRDCKIDLRRHVSEFHVGAAFFCPAHTLRNNNRKVGMTGPKNGRAGYRRTSR